MKHSVDKLNQLSRKARRVPYAICVFAALVMVGQPAIALSEEKASDSPPPSDAKEAVAFEYILEDREDPFVPFITERATTSDVNMDEIIEPETKLTGMQLFEPGQLNLVALLKMGGEDFAMVEDFTGKGYMISEGTKIGKRGIVKDIVTNQVIIEETAQTRAGKKIVSKTVMVLKKEGEE